jgi:hypothetical protein
MFLLLPALLPLLAPGSSRAEIPATPVMTVYRFNGPLEVPTYAAGGFARRGTAAVDGALAQGTSVVPCLVVRDGAPLTDASGTPYVGFEVVVDARRATPDSTARFRDVSARRKTLAVRNHHCPPGVERVVDVRSLHALDKAPFFDPPRASDATDEAQPPARSELDRVVRAFHASRHCDGVQRRLIGRRAALDEAWAAFARESRGRFGGDALERARNLDYVMRTAIYEGHLDRGCSAYGACERSVIALSIRNRGQACSRTQGCRFAGDFQGVASAVSQYNIWDELLTQVSGLAACFLRPDLARDERYAKLQAIYEQSRGDVERILYGDDGALTGVFPGSAPAALATLRHYYHPPAMGKCFPGQPRVEYMSGAVARRGGDFALVASTRIEVGEKRGDGYEFRAVSLEEKPERDVLRIADLYPGFVVDARKVSLRASAGCRPWGTPPGCRSGEVGRHRKVPGWLSSGRPLRLTCRVRARDEACVADATLGSASVGGACDTAMQPVAGVP